MASWASTTETSGFDAGSYAMSAMDSRHSSRFFNDATVQSLAGYSVVGISATKIPEMREAIRTAVTNLQGYIDGIEEHAESSMAFKSDAIKAAVENYVLSVKEYSKALISDLLAFSDKLENVHQSWLNSTSTFASESIEGNKGSLSDNTTYYTEQF